VAAGTVTTVLLGAAPTTAGDAGPVVGVESGEGATKVPAEESASPCADTPGVAALGPMLFVLGDAAAVAEVPAGEEVPVAAGVPVGAA
jgi:hypothetical protein